MSTSAPAIDRATIERIVREIVTAQIGAGKAGAAAAAPKLVVSISARHVHLTDQHVEVLFGPGAS